MFLNSLIRTTIALSAFLASIPCLAQQIDYRLYGIAFSPYIGAQKPGDQISEAQIRARLTIVAQNTRWVRTYSVLNGLEKVCPIAHEMGLKCAAGASIYQVPTDDQEIAMLKSLIQAQHVDLAIVGTEVVFREKVNKLAKADYLITRINEVKAVAGAVPVATAEPYETWLDFPSVMAASSIVILHVYPFFEGISVDRAVSWVNGWYELVKRVAGSKPVYLGESGWPSAGNADRGAVASPENAAQYLLNFASWAAVRGVPYFYFEAFDEPFKASENTQGPFFGVWDGNGVVKAGMNKLFQGTSLPDNWSGQSIANENGAAEIELTYVPAFGQTEELSGRVRRTWPSENKVACYVYVNGSWYVKPFASRPLTPILSDGTFSCALGDTLETKVAAFVVPNGYIPPTQINQVSPAPIINDAIAFAMVSRTSAGIKGTIRDGLLSGIDGVQVNLTGSLTRSTVTSRGGQFSFYDLTPGGNYTITPVAAGLVFNPGNTSVSNLSGVQTADFSTTTTIPSIVVTSVPSGLRFSSAGAGCEPSPEYSTPRKMLWLPGSACTIAFVPQSFSVTGVTYTFAKWENGTVNPSRAVVAPSTNTTFQASFGYEGPPRPQYGGISPVGLTAMSQVFTYYTDHQGGADSVSSIQILFNSILNGAGACWVRVNPLAGTAKLVNDAASGELPGVVSPGGGLVANSQCTLSGNGFTVSKSGNRVTLTLPLVFSPAFVGPKNIYQYVADVNGQIADWSGGGSNVWNVGELGLPSRGTVIPNSGTGTSSLFSVTASHTGTGGAANISSFQVLFGPTLQGANACWILVYPQANLVRLMNNPGTQLAGTISPGAGSASNSQCTISGTGLSIAKSGNTVTVNIPITFSGSFAGAKNVYQTVFDVHGQAADWGLIGTWLVPGAVGVPQTGTITPANGGGAGGVFTMTASHTNGVDSISTVQILFNSVLAGGNACWVVVDRSNSARLVNDAATGYVGNVVNGAGGSASNSQCSISSTGFAVTRLGNTITVTLPITLTAAFGGSRTAYQYVSDTAGQTAGWNGIGSWTVNTGGGPQTGAITPASGAGLSSVFTFTAEHTGGANNITTLQVLFNAGLNGRDACWVVVQPQSAIVTLVNDQANGNTGVAITPGAGSTANSQCSLSGAGFSVNQSLNSVTVTLPITFSTGFAGLKTAYQYVVGAPGQVAGWSAVGTWTVGATGVPQLGGITPGSGAGRSQTFAVTASHSGNVNNLNGMHVLFNSVLEGSRACWVTVFFSGDGAAVLNDDATGITGGTVNAGSGTSSNSQCTLSGVGYSVTRTANTVTVNLPITFDVGFAGPKKVFQYVIAKDGQYVNWSQIGTWTAQ